MRPPDLPVAVVGGGASGLAAAAALGRCGIGAVVLDADAQIGGTWARRYDRLCLHTVRAFSGLPYLPLPREYPRYVPKDLYARYLQEYAARFELDVRLGHSVARIARSNGSWTLATSAGSIEARAVVVATGRHREPRLPAWARATPFTGPLLHSSEYRNGRFASGLRVLVVGLGNSGAEIACDLVEQGARTVAVSARRAPPIAARELAGVPLQLLGIVLAPLPARAVDAGGGLLRRAMTRDLRRLGLSPEAWSPFAEGRPPVIDAGFLRQLRAGAIEIRPDVGRLTERGAVFADASEQAFDIVVAATGFTSGLDRLLDAPEALDAAGNPRPSGRSDESGVFFAGFRESPRGQLYEAKRGAFALACAVSAYLEASRR